MQFVTSLKATINHAFCQLLEADTHILDKNIQGLLTKKSLSCYMKNITFSDITVDALSFLYVGWVKKK